MLGIFFSFLWSYTEKICFHYFYKLLFINLYYLLFFVLVFYFFQILLLAVKFQESMNLC